MPTQTARRPLTARDLFALRMTDDPQLSPDGTRMAWVETHLDPEQNRYRSELRITDLASGEARAPVTVEGTHPRWSPDGRQLVFLAPDPDPPARREVDEPAEFRGRLAQLWTVAADGGEPRMLTRLIGGVQQPRWSPGGDAIAFTTLVDVARGLETVADSDDTDDPFERFNRDVLVVDRIRWKSDALGLVGNHYRHVARLDLDSDGGSAGDPVLLTSGRSEFTAPTWSPDGATLAIAGNLDPDFEFERKQFVYLLDARSAGTTTPRELFGLEDMRSNDLAFSPDGATLAVCGHDDPVMGHYGLQRLWLISVADGSGECVTPHLDLAFGDYSRNQDLRRYGGDDGPRWLPDGSGLLLLVNEGGEVQLAELSLATRELTRLTQGDHAVCAFTTDTARSQAALLITTSTHPCDLFLLERGGGGALRQLTEVNAGLLAEIELSDPIRFKATSGDVEVDGWIHAPPQRAPGERTPVILYTGGGPGGMRASVFWHEAQLYAANGYTVINCNARGNYGYGEAFSHATRGKWGDLDYDDNMAYLDAALATFDFLDPERLAVAGGSYGGYMATWIIARQPRFKAAVVDRSLVNRNAFYGTGDIGFLLDRVEFDGKLPWEIPEVYLERSPIHYVGNIKTPTLVVHSALDHRCPVGNGEQLYIALRRLGVPTELVRFPNETHELSRNGRPWHRVFRLERYLGWFGRWL